MTMAKVKNGEVTQVGLPSELRSLTLDALANKGWHKVVGTLKPAEQPPAGYQWEYGAEWSVNDNAVLGTWSQNKKPQPYPSWSWVDGEGWVAPTPRPEGNYYWSEQTQEWVKEELDA